MDTNQLNQLESKNNLIDISTKFTKNDLINGLQFSQDIGVQVSERPCKSQDEIIEQYQALKNFKYFMQSLDQDVFMLDSTEKIQLSKSQKRRNRRQKNNDFGSEQKTMTVAEKQKQLHKQYLNNIALNVDRSTPIIDSSGDEEMQMETDAEGNVKISSKENDEMDDMFRRDTRFFEKLMNNTQDNLTDEQYVKMKIKQNRCFFNVDRGHTDAKKANLGDIKSTKIESPHILSYPLFELKQEKTQMIKGNVKAMVPLMREKFSLMYEEIGIVTKEKYKKVQQEKLKEKRIFGIMTTHQVGHIPNLQISFTEDEQNFNKDTYMFKSVGQNGLSINIDKEIYKQNGVNEYNREDIKIEEQDQIIEPGTINQIEIFHKYLISDLYKRHKDIQYDTCLSDENSSKTKKYYIIPLKIDKNTKDPNELNYKIDKKLLEKVERLCQNGYKNEQQSIINWLNSKKLITDEERRKKLDEIILVKEDKPSNCYTFHKVLENLKDTKAEVVASAIRGKPENLHCNTGFELIFQAQTRFNCIRSFRELLLTKEQEQPGYMSMIEKSPIILLNPTKPIHNEKLFKYDLQLCPKKPNKKNDDRRANKIKNDLTTNQGMPIFSTYNIYKHYLNLTQWNRASQLPQVLSFFERCLNANQLIAKLSLYVHPEFAVWATSCPGVASSRKSYQTLETYGDTILKLAGTMLAYDQLEKDPNVNENMLSEMKNSFITNLCIFRLGQRLKLREHMRMKDPDSKKWDPPFAVSSINTEEFLSCTGKNIADGVESLLGAVFLSNNLHKTLQFISDIDLIPVVQADLMKYFPDKDLTFHLYGELDCYQFDLNDTVNDIFNKYYSINNIEIEEKTRILKLIEPKNPVLGLGSAFDQHFGELNKEMYDTADLKNKLIEFLAPVEDILNYKFKNKYLLLEAFSHSSFTEAYQTGANYEILEVLGDAVLDYVANSNLIKFTMFEKYNVKERLEKEFVTSEDFQPFDAHQAKSMLTKNNFLAQLMCLFGLQEYILLKCNKSKLSDNVEPEDSQITEQNGTKNDKDDKKPSWWHKKNREGSTGSQYHDTQKFIKYSFQKNFRMNSMEFEPYKAPKILGDVFEAIIGAIFKDGGIEEILLVLKKLMAPFVVYVAKYSKNIHKEPKEDFQQLAVQLKIKPQFKDFGEQVSVKLSEVLGKPLSEDEDFNDQMNRIDIIFNNGQIMTSAYGSTKQQAEKNASIKGLQWLGENKRTEINQLLAESKYDQSLKACFIQFDNLKKYYSPVEQKMNVDSS